MYALVADKIEIGNVRETFVLNQLKKNNNVLFSAQSDFFVNDKYTFEVGGKNKKRNQIKDVENSFIIADDIEYGTDRRIPIWLLGFLYYFFSPTFLVIPLGVLFNYDDITGVRND